MKTAVIYARVSSKEQEKEGYSIPAQLKLLRAYAGDKGMKVRREFVDVETAKQSGRTGFNEMAAFLKEHEREGSCAILVEKTDRLYRNLKDWVTLDGLEVDIHFVKEGDVISPDSRSSQKFMHGIRVLMAKNYIDNLSEETKKGLLEKAEQGLYPSVAPLGYINIQCGDKKYIQPDPALAPIVKQVFEWYASGRHSLKALTQKANESGLAFRKSNGRIPKSTVHKMLTNPLYMGEFDWKGKRYKGIHDPIITPELFEQVQEMLAEKGNGSRKTGKHDWAFTGLVRCPCGAALTAEIKKGKYVYYHCTGGKGPCTHKAYVREEVLDDLFGQLVNSITLDEDVVALVVKALKESFGDEKAYHDAAIAQLEQKKKRLMARIEKMYFDKLDGEIDGDFYDANKRKFEQEVEQINRQVAQHDGANLSYLDAGVDLIELAGKAGFLYAQQPLLEKRRLLEFLLSNSVYEEGKLTANFREPFDYLAKTNAVYASKKAEIGAQNAQNEIWLLGSDSNQRPSG